MKAILLPTLQDASFLGPKSRLKSNFDAEKSIKSRFKVEKVDFKYRLFDLKVKNGLIRTHLKVLSVWKQYRTKVEKLFSTILSITNVWNKYYKFVLLLSKASLTLCLNGHRGLAPRCLIGKR